MRTIVRRTRRCIFPAPTTPAQAQRVTLAAGQELNDLVMMLKPMKATRVTGTAMGSDGKPMTPGDDPGVAVERLWFHDDLGRSGASRRDVHGQRTCARRVHAARAADGRARPDPETATTTITATGEDITDVHLVGAKPSTVTGRLIVDPAAAQSLPSTLMITAFPMQNGGIVAPPAPPARIADDSTFELKAPPGLVRISLGGGFGGAPAGWTIRSIRLNGVDVTDAGIDVKPNEDVSGLEVELTNKLTTISGLVTNARGEAVKDYSAIAFAQDREQWKAATRYQGSGRPDQDGRFKITGLPPGDYYIVARRQDRSGPVGRSGFSERDCDQGHRRVDSRRRHEDGGFEDHYRPLKAACDKRQPRRRNATTKARRMLLFVILRVFVVAFLPF